MRQAVGFSLVALWALVGAGLLVSVTSSQDIDQMQRFGKYNIFYNVVNSTFLTPELADRYGLERSEDTAVVTVSVRSLNDEGEMTDQPAEVSGTVTDLVQQHELSFEEYRDPQAVYYIAELPASGRTELDFSLNVRPRDSEQTYELEFTQEMYPPVPPR